MTNDDKYARAVIIAARDIKRLRGAVRIQSAAIAPNLFNNGSNASVAS